MSDFKKGDTFTIAGDCWPLTRSERAQNGWRRRRHKKLIRPHRHREYVIRGIAASLGETVPYRAPLKWGGPMVSPIIPLTRIK